MDALNFSLKSALHNLAGRYARYSGVPKEHPDVNDMTTSASIESSMERSQSILSSSALNWYALRITYGRELALQEYLNSEGIENFIPMHYEYTIKNERRVRKLDSRSS